MTILQSNSRIIKSSNQEISDYVNRINAAGGSISDTSVQAHRTFIQTLKQKNIRDKFLEIGTYAGNNLNAALIKLIYPAEIQSTLTNVGFVGGDYSEVTGLTGDATGTKYLKTGFIPSSILSSALDEHLSVYARNTAGLLGVSSQRSYLGCNLSSAILRIDRDSNNTRFLGSSDAIMTASGVNVLPGHLIGSVVAINQAYYFYNGSSIVTDATLSSATLPNAEIAIFANGDGSSINRGSNLICTFHSIGYGISPSQAADFYAAVQTLQTALGRQV